MSDEPRSSTSTVDQVLLAEPRGFCAGVEMAIKALAWMVRSFPGPVYCYHEIVHNKLVVKRFEDQGVVFVDEIDEVPPGSPIMLSAHGSAPEGVEADDGTLYDYEPSEEAILADLLPRAVATQIFAALLENGASEQGARMSAMDNATRNAGEMIDKLTIQYNRSRQAVITNELIEIISGAEAL